MITKSGTSCSCPFRGLEELRVWQTRRLREHPGLSWPSIRGICMRQSSCGLPHPKHRIRTYVATTDFFRVFEPTYLFGCNWLLRRFRKLFNGLGIVSQIILATNEDNRKTLAEMQDFGDPLSVCISTLMPHCVSCNSVLPSLERCRGNRGNRWRSK